MLRTFQYRLRPNKAQVAALEYVLADSCETYNAALQERRDAWRLQRKSISYYDQQAELTELRKDPRFAVIACDIQREPLRRVDRAFKDFFRRCKSGEKKPGFPRFRSLQRYDSFAFGNNNVVIRERSIKIPNFGDIRAKGSRTLEGKPKACVVKRIGKKWVASVVCDIGPAPEKCSASNPIGIDVGIKSLATLSDSSVIENPRWTRKHEARIAAANRALARKQKRSKNRLKAREALRRAHRRLVDARRNFTHHASKYLVSKYDLIAFEKLNIKGMAQGTFSKSINPRGTSIRCSGCGERVKKTLTDRRHVCSCGVNLDRDHNAAINILALGKSAVGQPAKSMQESVNSCI